MHFHTFKLDTGLVVKLPDLYSESQFLDQYHFSSEVEEKGSGERNVANELVMN